MAISDGKSIENFHKHYRFHIQIGDIKIVPYVNDLFYDQVLWSSLFLHTFT